MNSNIFPIFLAQAPAQTAATTAQPAAPGAAPTDAPAPAGGGFTGLLPFILIFAIFYFIMIRPAQRKEKERKQQISELRAGTKILFAGGFIGTIVEVKDATFRVEVADDVVVEIARGAVQRALKDDETPADSDTQPH
ncbi:MAG: preprotein translocase subunit YajC [Kiritimatiellia bacterium]|jgi:preprotein translocase subunit YajC